MKGLVLATKRKAISTRTRFEIFKRDGFTCQYCGGHPPSAILHVDHIVPVSKGGTNTVSNLITACAACNFGKSNVSLTLVPQSLREKAKEIAEREKQLKGYRDVLQQQRDRIERDVWQVANTLIDDAGINGISKQWLESIRMFNERLDLEEVIDCARIANSKCFYSEKKTFLYFCGVCWNRVKEKNGAC
ncbi:MAG: HNH endonuclease [Rhodocyclaceae bacterium]|nr:HNH endonuclease [Rhodocyclaceae bacterium]